MSELSKEARVAVENEVRRILQQELMTEVREHRTFLGNLSKRTIGAITTVFVVVIAAFFFYLGRTVNEARSEIYKQIDSKIVDYRIVETNRLKTQEFVEIAVDSSQKEIEKVISNRRGELIEDLKDTLSHLADNAINQKVLTSFNEQLDKLMADANESEETLKYVRTLSRKVVKNAEEIKQITSRIEGIRLVTEYDTTMHSICGKEVVSSADDLTFMYGYKDGKGCEQRNNGYYKMLSLVIPKK